MAHTQSTLTKIVGRWTALPTGAQTYDQLTIGHDKVKATKKAKRKTARHSRRVNRRRSH